MKKKNRQAKGACPEVLFQMDLFVDCLKTLLN